MTQIKPFEILSFLEFSFIKQGIMNPLKLQMINPSTQNTVVIEGIIKAIKNPDTKIMLFNR